MKPLLAAWRFLTIVPVPGNWGTAEEDLARSVPWFPLIGLLLGIVAAALGYGLTLVAPPLVVAAALVIVLLGFSGGLHLDGLADTADGFFSSRSRERILEIMKDSHTGAMGVMAIVCVLLLKFAALASLPAARLWPAVLLMPVAGRTALVMHMALLPYARPSGLGAIFYRQNVRGAAFLAAGVLAAVAGGVLGTRGLAVWAACVAVVLVLSAYVRRKIGGATGDTLGAVCEVVEIVPALMLTLGPLAGAKQAMTMPHGGNLHALAQRAGLDRDEILDFSASINPLGPPEGLRAVLTRNIERLVHYPDPDCTATVELLARRHQVTPDQVVVGNGSTEIFYALARALPFARAVIPVPSYADYAAAIRAASPGWGGSCTAAPQRQHRDGSTTAIPTTAIPTCREVCLWPLKESDAFALDWPALEAELRGGELVLLGQPNNPTGRPLDDALLLALAARYPTTTFVVDEAFADFMAGYQSLAGRSPSNVIVVRSLTKFYAIPGLRLGFAVAAAAIAQQIRSEILPWSVNALAQEAAAVLLADGEYARQSIELIDRERTGLSEELTNLGLCVYPSATNFLLVRLDRAAVTAPELAERLLHEGIAIRTFTREQHLDGRFFRVAVRTAAENARLLDALAESLGRPRPPHKKPRRAAALMLQGTSSNAGKSVLTAALCRILLQDGVRVAPFKAQNMSLNSFVARDGGEMGRAQVVQAQACRLDPDVRMNPVLLKPNSDTGCQVIVRGRPVGNMGVGEYVAYKPQAFAAAKDCYDSLAAEYDAIILEGAGSPGEVNLKSHDIVNMRMAEYATAPVLVVGDIDRGGVFASFVGTMEVLAPWERKLVAGWIVNRFRGDAGLLGPALQYTQEHTGRPVLGVVPYLANLGLPQEDSVEFKSGALDQSAGNGAAVEIAVIDLPHISNFTDFDALRSEGDVRLRIIRSAADLNGPDAVIIPGSKNTLGDLQYLTQSGLAQRIAALALGGTTEIVGICGGLQMLGRAIHDPLGIESAAENSRGLGLLGASTVMAAEKTLVRTTARHVVSGLEVTGYEIHHGQTDYAGCQPLLVRPDGQVVGIAGEGERVWGTYLHGVFDADGFRRWFVDRLRVRRGLPAIGTVVGRYDIEPALDRLAEVVRASVRINEIYRLMGLR